MLKQERRALILQAVNEHKFVSLSDLISLTGASESSVRADLVELSSEGKLIRLRGGAQALNDASSSYELSVEAKMGIEVEAKKRIASYAASLIPDGSFVYIDAGTSTYYLVEEIVAEHIKIVTNSLILARKLKMRGYQVYVVGGEFKLTTDAFIGTMTCEFLSRFTFDVGFFGTNGIDLEKGFTTPDYEEAVVKKTAMAQTRNPYILADHSKFGVITAISFHPFQGNIIITDSLPREEFQDKGIKEACK